MVKSPNVAIKVVVLLGMLLAISSCSSTKNLAKDDFILSRNVYKFITDDDRIDKNALKENLRTLVKQVPVKKNFLNPRTWNKPLTKYDRKLTIESGEAFAKFLQNRKGFYQADVTYQEDRKGRNIEVVYNINLGNRYYISSFKYQFEDSVMARMMVPYESEKAIDVGEPLDADKFEIEKARVVNAMKNEGYANFNGNYIEFRGDSTAQGVEVVLYVFNPLGAEKHIQYRLGDINIYTEHSPSINPVYKKVDSIGTHFYYSKSDKFLVEPSSIDEILPLRSDYLFKKSREIQTNRNLTRLSPYRFAVMDPYTTSDTSSIYNYNIFLAPYQNKWIMDSGINLFYSSISANVGQNLFGFSGNVTFQNRNFKNRAVRHSIGLEGTLEFNFPDFPSLSNIIPNTVSLQLNNKFEIPKVIDIFKITNVLNRLNVISDESLENVSANGTTTVDMSVGYTGIYNFYNLTTLNASWAYNFQPNNRLRYTIRQIGFNIVDTQIKDFFRENILINNPLLERSFDDNFFTGFLFRELSIVKQTEKTPKGSQFLFIGNFELSGFENFLVNKLVKAVSSYDKNWAIGGLEFSDFFRLEGDVRYYKDVRPRSSFASKFNVALAVPYNGDVVPYIKQYFVGGPNSIRGWQLRQLGPGGYTQENINNTAFFQTGDFKLDFSAEYRFDLFWYLEGALFLDGGNVWLLRNDVDRPGAQLSADFLDQIALASGWGIRLDFDYFIFRFDFGYKLRNAAPDPETGKRFVLGDNNLLGNISFAINYPF